MSFFEFPHTRTYDSDLGWLIKTVSSIGSQYQELVDYMNTHKVEYLELEARVKALEDNIDSFEAEIDRRFYDLEGQLRSDINAQIAAIITEVNDKLSEVDSALNDLEYKFALFKNDVRSLVVQYYNLGTAYTDFKIEELINSLPEITTVYVYNPIRGEITTLQIAINDLYDLGRPEALTALEYDSLELTASEYDALEITAIDYDLRGRALLEELGIIKSPWHYMYSPFTGEYVPLQNVITELSNLHKDVTGAITASEYDALELTASDYDAYEISAYDYDWIANTILI